MTHGFIAQCVGRTSVALLLLAGTAACRAQGATPVDVATVDKDFAVKTAQGGRLEVELAALAEKKTANDKVRSLATTIHTDHDRANAELQAIARRKGIALETAESSEGMALRTKLSGLSGDAFDRAYVDAMVDDHQTDIAAFERYAKEGQDPDLKAFAAKTVPTLRTHLNLAQAARDLAHPQ